MKALVIGNMMTEEGCKKVEYVEQVALSNPTIQRVIPLREGLLEIFKNWGTPDYDWKSIFFEHFIISCIEKADRIICLNGESNVHLSKGWIYGYCFSQGKPIVLMQEHDNMAVHTDVFASHSVLATLGDVRELSSYDFREMNAVYTKS